MVCIGRVRRYWCRCGEEKVEYFTQSCTAVEDVQLKLLLLFSKHIGINVIWHILLGCIIWFLDL
jgi:hypothetical protein